MKANWALSLTIGIFSNIFVAIVSYYIAKSNLTDSSPFIDLMLSLLIAFSMILIVIIIQRTYNTVINTSENILNMFNASDAGLKIISTTEMLKVVCEEILASNRVRVIGMGRQFKTDDNSPDSNLIKKYYKNTELRFNETIHEGKSKLIYQRIAPRIFTNEFLTHLDKCFESAKQNNHNYEIALFDDFSATYTYIIFEERLMILQVQNLNEEKRVDTVLNFITQNKSIITKYINHFDNIESVP